MLCSECGSAGSSESDAGPGSTPELHMGMSIPAPTGAATPAWGPGTSSASSWAGAGTKPDPTRWVTPVPSLHPKAVSATVPWQTRQLWAPHPPPLPALARVQHPPRGWQRGPQVAHHAPAHPPHGGWKNRVKNRTKGIPSPVCDAGIARPSPAGSWHPARRWPA